MGPWKLNGTQATGTASRWRLEFDAAQPTSGIDVRGVDGASAGAIAFRDPRSGDLPPLEECYLRGDDLVASYPEQPPAEAGLHLQIAPREMDEGLVIQLTVSVQTTLLDCHPTLDIELPGRDVARHALADAERPETHPPASAAAPDAAAAASANQILGGPLPLWVLLAPRDYPTTRIRAADGQLVFRLFEEFLEKGVIRKTRLWLLLAHRDASDLASLYRRLCEAPLPLTT